MNVYSNGNKAISALRQAEYQQDVIKARILKLQKREDEANKKYKETCRKQELVKNMNAIKNEKFEIKRQWYMDHKQIEEQNR